MSPRSYGPPRLQGRPVTRLSAELQLIYITAHWYHQYNILAVEGAMVAMVDLLDSLESCKSILHWEQILEGVHGSAVALPLSLLLTYLQRRDLIAVDAEILRELLPCNPHWDLNAPSFIVLWIGT